MYAPDKTIELFKIKIKYFWCYVASGENEFKKI